MRDDEVSDKYTETHCVIDDEGYITMAELGRRSAAKLGPLTIAQLLDIRRAIMSERRRS